MPLSTDYYKQNAKDGITTFNPNQAKDKLLERLSYLDNLTDFTFSILQLEGAIKTKKMPMEMQMEVASVIMEQLKSKGVPDEAIIGKKICNKF